MEWTAKAVWWVRAVAVGVLVMLVAGENAGREYTMKRAKLTHKAEELRAHAGKAAQARWAKERKAQNG